MTDTLKLYVRELQDTVQAAALNFDIWWVYKSKDTRPKYIDSMNRYNLFFQISIHAHFVAQLVALYRLYETRPDAYNIPGLLKNLSEGSHLSQNELSEIEEIYEKAKPLWVKVNILRNKAFGHRSKAHTVEEVFSEAGVSPDELKLLVDYTKEFLNIVTLFLYDSTHLFNLNATKSTTQMLDDLNELHIQRKG